MGRLNVSLTSRLSINVSPKKTFLKWGGKKKSLRSRAEDHLHQKGQIEDS